MTGAHQYPLSAGGAAIAGIERCGGYLAIAGWIAIIGGEWITGTYLRLAGF